MAAFEQRDSGYWQARVRRRGWPPQSKSFRTKVAAEAWARAAEAAMDAGSFVTAAVAERTTFEQIAKRFKKEFAPDHYRGQGWVHKLNHLIDRLGDYSLASLTSDRVAWYRDQRLADPDPRYKDAKAAPRVSGATVKTELDLLSKVLGVATKEFRIPLPGGNPVDGVRKPTGNPSRQRRLVADERERLIAACERSTNKWLKPAVLLALETAMREGEILSLRRSDIDMDKRIADLKKTKNGDDRTIPLTSQAVAIITALPSSITGRVIPITNKALYQVFTTACRRAGIEDFHFHDLRHEALSVLASRGGDQALSILELAAISGHRSASSLRMLQVYVHHHAADLAKKLG
jgi:integrase